MGDVSYIHLKTCQAPGRRQEALKWLASSWTFVASFVVLSHCCWAECYCWWPERMICRYYSGVTETTPSSSACFLENVTYENITFIIILTIQTETGKGCIIRDIMKHSQSRTSTSKQPQKQSHTFLKQGFNVLDPSFYLCGAKHWRQSIQVQWSCGLTLVNQSWNTLWPAVLLLLSSYERHCGIF